MDQTNLDIYGSAPIPWSRALAQLEAGAAKSCWLATTRPDGRPHVAGVGALWVEGRLYFTSGAGTRKSRNLAANPHCAVALALPGLDLVVEGTAARVTDAATLARLAERYAAQGWPATVGDGGRRGHGRAVRGHALAVRLSGRDERPPGPRPGRQRSLPAGTADVAALEGTGLEGANGDAALTG